jgi:hypothetical protein
MLTLEIDFFASGAVSAAAQFDIIELVAGASDTRTLCIVGQLSFWAWRASNSIFGDRARGTRETLRPICSGVFPDPTEVAAPI